MYNQHTKEDLLIMQALPLDIKVRMTQTRIREWVRHWGEDKCCISFSGGKDSTVLLYLVRELYPDMPAIYADTGLEYPEIRQFANSFDNVIMVRPKKSFVKVLTEYGYPVISKEVSEAVMYARRFVDSVISGGEINTNTLSTDSTDSASTQKMRGVSPKEIDSARLLALAHTASLTEKKPHYGNFLTKRLLGLTDLKAQAALQAIVDKHSLNLEGGVTKVSELTVSSKELANIPTRFARQMGWLTTSNNYEIGGSFDKDRSSFNMTKWQPLLDMDFRISHLCCTHIKKAPLKIAQKQTGREYPFLGLMTAESRLREQAWLRNGCNAFNAKRPSSSPMSFWTEQDVLRYIKENDIPIASVYGEVVQVDSSGNIYEQTLVEDGCKYKTTGCQRTGCIYCPFGCHLEKGENRRFVRLKKTHPKQYDYCMGGGEYDSEGLWIPNKEGLGLYHVFDELNKVYGKNFIVYE